MRDRRTGCLGNWFRDRWILGLGSWFVAWLGCAQESNLYVQEVLQAREDPTQPNCLWLDNVCYRPMEIELNEEQVSALRDRSTRPSSPYRLVSPLGVEPQSPNVFLDENHPESTSVALGPGDPDVETLTRMIEEILRPWDHDFYRTTVKLFLDFPNGGAACSGVMVGKHTIFTAGHCIYDHPKDQGGFGLGGFVNRVRVCAAMSGRTDTSQFFCPYDITESASAGIMTTNWWKDDRDYRGDVALIRLQTDLGVRTGIPARTWNGAPYSGTLNAAGYPGESPYRGNILYHSWGAISSPSDYDEDYIVCSKDAEAYQGMSGGPTWLYYANTNERRVIATNSTKYQTSGICSALYRDLLEQKVTEWEASPANSHETYWQCSWSGYASNNGCDCLCGVWDPDCDANPNSSRCGVNEICLKPGVCAFTCQCSSGPCCDGCSFRSSGVVCQDPANQNFYCLDNQCGDDVWTQTSKRYCSGNAASCDGAEVWGTGVLHADCTSQERCTEGVSSCQYDAVCATGCRIYDNHSTQCSAAMGCSYYQCSHQCHPTGTSNCDAGCLEDCPCECSTGACCDGCRFRASAFVCEQEAQTRYLCSSTACGSSVHKETAQRYCPGNASSCSGELAWGSKAVFAVCSASQRCMDGNPACQTDPSCHTDCRTYDQNATECSQASGCSYYACSQQCHPVGTNDCNAGCQDACGNDLGDGAILLEQTNDPQPGLSPGASFVKRWTLQNTGNTTWRAASSHRLAFLEGMLMGAPVQVTLPSSIEVAPGDNHTWEIEVTAPLLTGVYEGRYRMEQGDLGKFGPVLGFVLNVTDSEEVKWVGACGCFSHSTHKEAWGGFVFWLGGLLAIFLVPRKKLAIETIRIPMQR